MGYRVLASAPSNAAVDVLLDKCLKKKLKCCRLGSPARIDPKLLVACFVNLAGDTEMNYLSLDAKGEIEALYARLKKCTIKEERTDLLRGIKVLKTQKHLYEKDIFNETVNKGDVILGTCVGLGYHKLYQYCLEKKSDKYDGRPFDVLILDEAAQAMEAVCWIPIILSQRLIICGDHKQLPPVIKSKRAEAGGLGETLFSRLIDKLPQDARRTLTMQYRMNRTIMDWSSQRFYEGQIEAHESVSSEMLSSSIVNKSGVSNSPMVWIETSGTPNCGERNTSRSDLNYSISNDGEALIACTILKRFIKNGLPLESIGVITPYRSQVKLISFLLQVKDDSEATVVATVDKFQGQERDVIILSLVRSNDEGSVGFLADFRRLNVAITRAKKQVVVIADSNCVCNDHNLQSLYEYISSVGELTHASTFLQFDEWKCFDAMLAKFERPHKYINNTSPSAGSHVKNNQKNASPARRMNSCSKGGTKQHPHVKNNQKNASPARRMNSCSKGGTKQGGTKQHTYVAKKESDQKLDEEILMSLPPHICGRKTAGTSSSPSSSSQEDSSPSASQEDSSSPDGHTDLFGYKKKNQEIDNEDDLSDAFVSLNKGPLTCSYSICPEPVQPSYMESCQHCDERFCHRHKLPEAHGCDLLASQNAKLKKRLDRISKSGATGRLKNILLQKLAARKKQ